MHLARTKDEADQSSMHRLPGGYDAVIRSLARGLEPAIKLRNVVSRIDWSDNRITVKTNGGRVTCDRVIVTAPISILQQQPPTLGAIEFSPQLPAATRRALEGLAMGSVIRVTFLFKEPIWEHAQGLGAVIRKPGKQLERLSFLHTRERFPVWWTAFPVRAPVITGWCGGPPARELATLGAAGIESEAIATLARALHMRRAALDRMLEGCWVHDWERDPFARGAYSYPLVGGAGAFRALAKPIDERLYFAGEATDWTGGNGTVDGAIRSGYRVADTILQSSRAPRHPESQRACVKR